MKQGPAKTPAACETWWVDSSCGFIVETNSVTVLICSVSDLHGKNILSEVDASCPYTDG